VTINQLRKYLQVVLSFIFPIVILSFTSGIEILNPSNVDWLSYGDGQVEIAWEFYRNSPFFQFPVGQNYDYGMEISSSIIYNGIDPLFALFFKIFQFLLPERFQYFGLVIFANLALVYFISTKIISLFTRSVTLQTLFSLVILLSPVTLHRYIEYTHYTLTANWLILWSIYLMLNKKYSVFVWVLVLGLSALTHPYYIVMTFPFFITSLIRQPKDDKSLVQKLIEFYFVFTTTLFIIWGMGYQFTNNNLNSEEGFGRLRSNLLSFFNPYDWSTIFTKFPKPDDGNEGFAYIGLAGITILIISITIFHKKENRYLIKESNFAFILIPSILLFAISLSNKIALGSVELFQIPLPDSLDSLLSTFRASGRFAWPLAYVLMVWSAFVFIKTKFSLKSKSMLLTTLLVVSLFDQLPELRSEKDDKFSLTSKQHLTNSFWDFASKCYKNIIFYPPYPNVDGWYKYADYAQEHKMGINTGLLSRVDYNKVNESTKNIQIGFRTNRLNDDNIYVFSSSEFFNSDSLLKEIEMLNYSLSETTFVGKVDNKFTLAPNFANCEYFEDTLADLTPFKKINGVVDQSEVEFKRTTRGKEFLFENWSEPESWGTWGLGTNSSVLIPISDQNQYKSMVITAKTFGASGEDFDQLRIVINGIEHKPCWISTTNFSYCTIDLQQDSIDVNKHALYLEFYLNEATSPIESSKGDDPRSLGLGLAKINFLVD
jgi:hypothetical protein